jgi:excisionase family DNA binding protein
MIEQTNNVERSADDVIRELVMFSGKGEFPRLLLKAAEVQKATGYSRAKVYRLMSDGTLGTVREGKSVRVPISALLEFIRKATSPAA